MIEPILLLILFLIALVSAVPRSVVIDDETGDELSGQLPTYIAHWTQGSTCEGCGSKPDPEQAHDGTWHDATIGNPENTRVGITLQFTGPCPKFLHEFNSLITLATCRNGHKCVLHCWLA